MSDTQSFNYILTFMMLIVAGLALPYIGKNRQDLLGVTSIYRPLSLAFLFIHFGFLLAVSLFKWENSLWSPTTLLLSNIFIALEVRSVRTLRKRHIPPNWLALGTIGAAFFAFLMFQFSQPGTRVSIYSIGAMVNALWVMTELRKIKSYFPTYIYGLLTVSGYTLTFLLVVRYAVAVASGHFIVGQLQSPSYLVMTVAFLAYGCLFLFLLALNHGYTLSLWRAAAFQRRSAELSLLNVLRGIASARDNETGQHISRTNRYVRTLAANLKAKGLLEDGGDPNFIGSLVRAAPLHDLGKVTTPDSILLKKGRLSDQELTIMREHASAGAEILSAIAGAAKNKSATYEVMELAAKIASAHHEHWDGNGYPRRLKGKDIPQIARIMTVADVYDALTSARPYKAPWSHDEAETYIIGLSGSQFDPEVVAAFHEERETFRAIAERFAD